MAQPLSIETPDDIVMITTRTQNSRLWFIKNPKLEGRALAYLAKYVAKYSAKLYSYKFMGHHYHLMVSFPLGNKAAFKRDFNARVAVLTNALVETFEGGRVWGRRASTQILPNQEDQEHWFFYMALNEVSSGQVQRISEDEHYNSFSDAISGIVRKHKVFRQSDYNNHKRTNPKVRRQDYIETYELRFERLPGYESLSQSEYRTLMLEKLERRRVEIVASRRAEGKGFATAEHRAARMPGDRPVQTKTSSRESNRPICLTLCSATRRRMLEWYFSIRDAYREASKCFRAGMMNVEFPPGTYRPSIPVLVT